VGRVIVATQKNYYGVVSQIITDLALDLRIMLHLYTCPSTGYNNRFGEACAAWVRFKASGFAFSERESS